MWRFVINSCASLLPQVREAWHTRTMESGLFGMLWMTKNDKSPGSAWPPFFIEVYHDPTGSSIFLIHGWLLGEKKSKNLFGGQSCWSPVYFEKVGAYYIKIAQKLKPNRTRKSYIIVYFSSSLWIPKPRCKQTNSHNMSQPSTRRPWIMSNCHFKKSNQ